MFEDNRYENNSNQPLGTDNTNYQNPQTPNVNDWQTTQGTGSSFTSNTNTTGPNNYNTGSNVNSYEWGSVANKAQVPPKKKEKKPASRASVSLILIISIICSACLGIGGGVGTYFLMSKNAERNNSGLSVYKTEETGGSESTEGILSTEEITNKVGDSVVEIVTETVTYSMFYGQAVTEGAGSGVIIDKDGYIITNNHVIENSKKITVKLRNGNEYTAKLVGADADQDIALIKIEPKSSENLTVAVLGDSDKLAVGDKAVVIGNPLGELGGTVTDGIVSALDRQLSFDGKTMNLMQTDAAINPGNSGGGLFDGQGNLVGIIVAKASASGSATSVEGLGFAIPINDAQNILGDLKNYGYVKGKPAEIGVTLQDYMDMVYVYDVLEDSAAEKAGLQKGDKIMSIDGEETKSSSDVKAKISKSKAGDKLKFEIERDGSKKTLTVVIQEAKQDAEPTTADGGRGYIADDDTNSIWGDFGF